MTYLYLGLMTVLLIVGGIWLFSIYAKKRQAAIVMILLGLGFMMAAITHVQTQRAEQAAARASSRAKADESLESIDSDESEDDAESELIAESESRAESESIAASESVAESESIAQSESLAASESAASQAEADRIAASQSQAAAESARVASQQAAAYSDSRPAQATPNRSYAYAPAPATAAEETVYVSAAIPGRYHKDPNCRGLQRYGGAKAVTLSQARAQGFQAYCAYERYGSN